MSRANNVLLRAKFGPEGSILEFDLGNYSGGDYFVLRVHQLARGDRYWVVEGNGYEGTVFVAPVDERDGNDLDELAEEILREWRQDVLHKRDAWVRRVIEGRSGALGPAGDVPYMIPTIDERRKAEREANKLAATSPP